MNGINKSVLFAILIIGVATPANSQSNKKFEAFGSLGAIPYAAEVTGIDYGGGIGIRPYATSPTWIRGWEFEFNLSVTAPPQFNDPTQTRYTANVLYYFLSGRVQPYGLIGLGGWHDSDEAPFQHRNGFLVNAGGGLRIAISDSWSIRPEFRGFDLSHSDRFPRFARYGVIVGYHF